MGDLPLLRLAKLALGVLSAQAPVDPTPKDQEQEEEYAVVHWRRGDQVIRCSIGEDTSVNCNSPEELISKIKQILNSGHKERCIALNKLKISETLPIIKNCNISVCNDSSFSHLSASLGKPTIVLMSDTPLIYGSYSSKMYPIMPDGVENVTHGTEGKEKINPLKIFKKFQNLIS